MTGARMDDRAMPDLDSGHQPSMRLWVLAALGALAIHVGGAALAVAHLPTADSETELGAQAIEIGLEMMSPHLDPTDAPAGPNTEASAASPALAEQKAVVEEAELPKEVPTETVDPDRVVTLNNAEKPKEDEPKAAQVQTPAATDSVAQVAMATPSVEDVPQGRSQAPIPGTAKSLQLTRASWFARLGAHFEKHKRAPDVPKLKNVKVVVNVTFDRLGHVVSSSILEGSGDRAYDQAALSMLHRSDPVPKPPPLVADDGLNFHLPVIFSVPK
jgi:TonB family protein